MFTRPTYLSMKLVLSPVEDVTLCLVYHMFIVYVYCLLSAVSVWPGWAESCSFTSALVVCRLATVCPPVWPGHWSLTGVKLPGLGEEWARPGARDIGPAHRGQLQRWPGEETLRLCQGSWHDWDGGQDIIRYSDQWERDGPGLNYI